MDVNLHKLRLPDDKHRVAESLDLLLDPLHVEIGAFDEKFRAVTPAPFRKFDVDLRSHRLRGARDGGSRELSLHALESLEHAFDDDL